MGWEGRLAERFMKGEEDEKETVNLLDELEEGIQGFRERISRRRNELDCSYNDREVSVRKFSNEKENYVWYHYDMVNQTGFLRIYSDEHLKINLSKGLIVGFEHAETQYEGQAVTEVSEVLDQIYQKYHDMLGLADRHDEWQRRKEEKTKEPKESLESKLKKYL